jgi:protein ImuA
LEQIKNMRPPISITERPAGEAPAFPKGGTSLRLARLGRPKALPAHLTALLKGRVRSPGAVLPFDNPRVDDCLGGGLALGQLHEIGAAGLDTETAALPAGFIAALLARIMPARPVFWIAPESDLHPPGLLPYGLDPNRLVLVRSAKDVETLAAMEMTLREGAAAAVVGEVGQFDRTASRRLQLACLDRGSTGFVLRRWLHGHKTADRETSVAVTRWHLTPMPSAKDDRAPGLPRWHVALTHARGGRPGEWIMEALDDATHPLRVVAALADHASEPQRLRLAG